MWSFEFDPLVEKIGRGSAEAFIACGIGFAGRGTIAKEALIDSTGMGWLLASVDRLLLAPNN